MHTQVLGIAAAAAAMLAFSPGAASAHSVHVVPVPRHAALAQSGSSNTSAALAALNAYQKYLNALTANETTSGNQAEAVVTTVESNCSDALADLNSMSSTQVKKSALTDFGDEVDADLDLAYMATTKAALNKLGGALKSINWPSSAQSHTTTAMIAAERALTNLAPSNICADATTLDAAPLSEPTATLKFLKHYRNAANSLHSALGAFQALLAKYETSSETKLINSINSLVSSFSDQSSSTESTDAATVLSELGITSSN